MIGGSYDGFNMTSVETSERDLYPSRQSPQADADTDISDSELHQQRSGLEALLESRRTKVA